MLQDYTFSTSTKETLKELTGKDILSVIFADEEYLQFLL
jgi:hypothetical protein